MEWIKEIGKLVLVLLLQVLLFDHLHIANIGVPLVYILFLINLPVRIPRWVEMMMGLALGLIMDMWYSSLGVHMAACVAITYLRPIFLNNVVQDIERITGNISSQAIGAVEYTKCAFYLVLIHHFIVFLLEAWSLNNWWLIRLHVVVSGAMTFLVVWVYDRLNQ